MGVICTKPDADSCSLLKNYELKCKAAGTFGCFTILENISYNKLIDIANEYGSSIKVTNEHNDTIPFIKVAEWLNPDPSVNGACKFIIPRLKLDVFMKKTSARQFDFNMNDINIVYTQKIIDGEANAAKYIAEAFDNKYDDISNETTYRPLNNGCVFKIIIPPELNFKYINVEYKDAPNCSMQVNEVVLIMNQVCNDTLFNLLQANKIQVNDTFITKLMQDITPFMHKIHIKNITHLDIKLENIFQCKDKNNNIKYKIADYGGLKKNRTIYTPTDVFTDIVPSYVKDINIPFYNNSLIPLKNDPKFVTYIPKFDIYPGNLSGLFQYIKDYFSKLTDKPYEHAKFSDRYALALNIFMILNETNTLYTLKDGEKILRVLLDYNNTEYFDKVMIGGNKKQLKSNVSIDKNGKLRFKLDGHSYIVKNDTNRYFVMKGGNKVSCTKEVNKYNKK